MFSTVIEIGLKIGKVILDDKLSQNSKDTVDELLDKIDDMLNF